MTKHRCVGRFLIEQILDDRIFVVEASQFTGDNWSDEFIGSDEEVEDLRNRMILRQQKAKEEKGDDTGFQDDDNDDSGG